MLDDIFKALLDGAQSQSQPTQPQTSSGGGQQDMLAQLLQGALQGQQPPAHANQPENLAGMSGLLGGLLGGMGGSSPSQANPLIAPIANMLAEKLNISPAIASTIVNFALTALLARGKRQPGAGRSGQAEAAFDLDDIVNGDFAFSSGMAQQLAQQTGLPEQEAARSLQEAMVLLNEQAAAPGQMPSSQQQPGSFNDIIDDLMDALDVD